MGKDDPLENLKNIGKLKKMMRRVKDDDVSNKQLADAEKKIKKKSDEIIHMQEARIQRIKDIHKNGVQDKETQDEKLDIAKNDKKEI